MPGINCGAPSKLCLGGVFDFLRPTTHPSVSSDFNHLWGAEAWPEAAIAGLYISPLCRKEQHAIPLHVPRTGTSVGAGSRCGCSAEFRHQFAGATKHAGIPGRKRAYAVPGNRVGNFALEFANANGISAGQLCSECISQFIAKHRRSTIRPWSSVRRRRTAAHGRSEGEAATDHSGRNEPDRNRA